MWCHCAALLCILHIQHHILTCPTFVFVIASQSVSSPCEGWQLSVWITACNLSLLKFNIFCIIHKERAALSKQPPSPQHCLETLQKEHLWILEQNSAFCVLIVWTRKNPSKSSRLLPHQPAPKQLLSHQGLPIPAAGDGWENCNLVSVLPVQKDRYYLSYISPHHMASAMGYIVPHVVTTWSLTALYQHGPGATMRQSLTVSVKADFTVV